MHLTLKMISAQVVETSVTNSSSFLKYRHLDYHTIQTKECFVSYSYGETNSNFFALYIHLVTKQTSIPYPYFTTGSVNTLTSPCLWKFKMLKLHALRTPKSFTPPLFSDPLEFLFDCLKLLESVDRGALVMSSRKTK